jgi:hypothetical protein
MVNWTIFVNKPSRLDELIFLVPKDKITSLITRLLESDVWQEGDSITIEPSNMEYFDG